MSKIMPVQDYLKLTNSDKLEIERLLFETVKEEMENQFSFLKDLTKLRNFRQTSK